MRVLERTIYRGPNLFGALPMIRFQLDLGELEAWPTVRLEGFTDALLTLLPGLENHGCSYHVRGGFVRRLREGTWLGHVAEHIAIELQSLAGSPVTRGKTRSVKGRPGIYNVLYAYRQEEAGLMAGRLALHILQSLLPPELKGIEGLDILYPANGEPVLQSADIDLDRGLSLLRSVIRRGALGPTTASLVAEAERRGIPTFRLDEQSLVQLGWGSRQERLRASITGRSSHVAVEAAGNKSLTKQLLADAGVPVPHGEVVRSADEAVRAAARLRGPVVVKPLDGNHGRGVSIGLTGPDAVRVAFDEAIRHSRRVLVEQFFAGRDHRILVVDGQVVAVAERVPAHVVGDGASTIAELIEAVNRDPRRGEGHEKVMTKIKVDEHVRRLLAKAELDLQSVPEAGRMVQLRDTANLSTGGTAVDRTDEIHPENACIARRAALTIGLDIAGIDFLCPDITRSVRETGGGIVEVNAAPGFRMHLEPSEGRPRNVARPVIRMLYPDGAQSRIPIIAITGTNGKSTTTRMVAHIMRQTGATVGFTTTSGVYVNEERIVAADASGPKSARMVLRDPTVDVAVLETARGGILREGLGFDRADIGAVLNIQADHLGLKGINTLEDLAWVKAVVVESVRRGGASILNADDPYTLRMRRRAGGRTVLFSLRGGDDMPGFLQQHIAAGGTAVVREPGPDGGAIVIHDGEDRRLLMRAAEIPATLEGLADFNIANALAAVAIGHAHGVRPGHLRAALASFTSSFEQSPGRLNVFDGHGFRVIMDYAHNPASMTALLDLVRNLRAQHNRTIGTVSIPGDRRDEDIREMGEVAASGFDELVFRETPDGRGRAPGEVIALLEEGARAAGFPADHIHRLRREPDAVDFCLRTARAGDLVVLTPTRVEDTWHAVTSFKAGRAARATEAERDAGSNAQA